jgi:hypothetical protein
VDEEFEPGLVGVSGPVRGFHGDIVATINVAAPKTRLGRHPEAGGQFTRTIADEMSVALGAANSAEQQLQWTSGLHAGVAGVAGRTGREGGGRPGRSRHFSKP